LTGAVTTQDDQTGRSRRRRLTALLLAGLLIAGSCAAGGEASDEETPSTAAGDDGPNPGVLPTLAGGLELASVDPVQVLTGDGLAYGRPLPSQQIAADAFLEDPEVASVTTRRIYSLRTGRILGDALVLALDGKELFDQGVLDAFARGVVASLGDGDHTEAEIAGRTTIQSRGDAGTTVAYLEGDLLVVVRSAAEADADIVVERQLTSLAAGIAGAPDPRTPLVALPLEAAFVSVPTVTFQSFPPPEQETPPDTPPFAGATAAQGRYGVVAGERRTTVWAYTVDPQTYPWAEPLDVALAELAASRTAGAPVEAAEVLGRVVQRSDGEDATSARAFRHGGLALLVEGSDPAQLDAVVSAWIAALNAP
jgi:hypothetical protein